MVHKDLRTQLTTSQILLRMCPLTNHASVTLVMENKLDFLGVSSSDVGELDATCWAGVLVVAPLDKTAVAEGVAALFYSGVVLRGDGVEADSAHLFGRRRGRMTAGSIATRRRITPRSVAPRSVAARRRTTARRRRRTVHR